MNSFEALNLVILFISTFLCIVGNILVFVLILKFEFLQSRQNALILCLAASDFLYGFLVVPMRFFMDNIHHANMSATTYNKWFAGCQTAAVFNVFAYYGDYLSIASITLDRFLYIKYPFQYTQFMTNKTTIYIVAGIFFISLSFSILFVFVPDNYSRGEPCSVSSFIPPEYFAAFDVPLLTVTCTGMFYTFYIYYTMVRKTNPDVNAPTGSSKSQNKVTKMMFCVVSVFLLSNAFWYTVYFITNGMSGRGIGILQLISLWFWHVS